MSSKETSKQRADSRGLVTRLVNQLTPKLDAVGAAASDKSDIGSETIDKLKRAFS